MKELIIYQFQAKHIGETLRIVSNVLHSHKKESCIDRMVMMSIDYMNKVLECNERLETIKMEIESLDCKYKNMELSIIADHIEKFKYNTEQTVEWLREMADNQDAQRMMLELKNQLEK